MVDISIGNKTSPEANWNRQTGRHADRQADGRTNLCIGRLRLQKWSADVSTPPSGIGLTYEKMDYHDRVPLSLKFHEDCVFLCGYICKTKLTFVAKLSSNFNYNDNLT